MGSVLALTSESGPDSQVGTEASASGWLDAGPAGDFSSLLSPDSVKRLGPAAALLTLERKGAQVIMELLLEELPAPALALPKIRPVLDLIRFARELRAQGGNAGDIERMIRRFAEGQ